PAHDELAERLAALEERPVLFPGAGDRRAADLPPGLAEQAARVVAVAAGRLMLQQREPMLRVLLPVVVGGQRNHAAQALLADRERRMRIGGCGRLDVPRGRAPRLHRYP